MYIEDIYSRNIEAKTIFTKALNEQCLRRFLKSCHGTKCSTMHTVPNLKQSW